VSFETLGGVPSARRNLSSQLKHLGSHQRQAIHTYTAGQINYLRNISKLKFSFTADKSSLPGVLLLSRSS